MKAFLRRLPLGSLPGPGFVFFLCLWGTVTAGARER